MLTEPLPTTLDLRKLATREVTISGILRPRELERLKVALAGDEGEIKVQLECYRDDEHRSIVRVVIDARLQLTCQRCLEPMAIELHSDNLLAVVWSEEQAEKLPRHLDPLIITEDVCDTRLVVEDEVFLSLPIVSYHTEGNCNKLTEGYNAPPVEDVSEAQASNPFSVLEQLKPGSKS